MAQLAADLRFYVASAGAAGSPHPREVLELPSPENSPHAEVEPDRSAEMRRMAILSRLLQAPQAPLIVASLSAVLRRTLPPEEFASRCHVLEVGTTIPRDDLMARLLGAGFTRHSFFAPCLCVSVVSSFFCMGLQAQGIPLWRVVQECE